MPRVLAQPELCLRLLSIESAVHDGCGTAARRRPTEANGTDEELRALWTRALEETAPTAFTIGELRLTVAPGACRTDACTAARAASMMVTDSDAAEDGVRMCGSAAELLRALFAGEDTFLKFGRLRFAVV